MGGRARRLLKSFICVGQGVSVGSAQSLEVIFTFEVHMIESHLLYHLPEMFPLYHNSLPAVTRQKPCDVLPASSLPCVSVLPVCDRGHASRHLASVTVALMFCIFLVTFSEKSWDQMVGRLKR